MQSSTGETLSIAIVASLVFVYAVLFPHLFASWQICYHVLGLVHGIWTPIPRAVCITVFSFLSEEVYSSHRRMQIN